MGTIVDRATAASQAEVCSLYLMDRDGTGVTLAATNGLDPEKVGVARLPLGVGITGSVAESRQPVASPNVHDDPRFHWIRGVDKARYTSMCSVPLIWNQKVVGVLNVQTVRQREFSKQDVSFLEALAGLLAGTVERNRLQKEAEAQVESLRAIDEARASLVAVVTHALRTPLAVVRAYVELLGSAARRRDAVDPEAIEAAGVGDQRPRTGRSARSDGRLDSGQPARADSRFWPRDRARPGRGGRRHRPRAGAPVPPPSARG